MQEGEENEQRRVFTSHPWRCPVQLGRGGGCPPPDVGLSAKRWQVRSPSRDHIRPTSCTSHDRVRRPTHAREHDRAAGGGVCSRRARASSGNVRDKGREQSAITPSILDNAIDNRQPLSTLEQNSRVSTLASLTLTSLLRPCLLPVSDADARTLFPPAPSARLPSYRVSCRPRLMGR